MLRWFKHLFPIIQPENVGGRGETNAASWLEKNRKYVVIARNWRSSHDRRQEIDLVCRDGDALVFVEVKTRVEGSLVPGYFAVNRRKKKAMRRAVDAYLSQLKPPPRTFRFDIVEVAHSGAFGLPEVLHFENIPLFTKHYRR